MTRPTRRARPDAATRVTPVREVPVPAPAAGPAASVATGLVALGVSLWLAPGVPGDKDASEFTLALAKLGVAHPTGYPIYTILGHGFVTLAHAAGVGWARAANAWSAVGGGLAAALLHALAARLMAREGVPARSSAWIALLPVAVFALNPLVTVETTLAEVNAFHLAWVAGAMLAMLATADSLREIDAAHDARRFAWLGALAGLGLAHHATSMLVIAPCAIGLGIASARSGRLRPGVITAAAGAALLPLTSYAFVAWRAFHPNEAHWPTLGSSWGAVWKHVTGAEFRFYLGSFAPSTQQRAALQHELWPWLGALVPIALAWGWRSRGTSAVVRAMWLCALLLTSGYAFSYGVTDPASYFLPPFLLALAVTPAAFARWSPLRRHGKVVCLAAAIAVTAQSAAWVGVARDRTRTYEAFERQVHTLWRSVPDDSCFVVWMNDMVHMLVGYQVLSGEKPRAIPLHTVELTHDAPRAAFVHRHGFDPADRRRIGPRVAALQPSNVDELARAVGIAVAREIATGSRLPVFMFLPEVPALRRLEGLQPASDSTRSE